MFEEGDFYTESREGAEGLQSASGPRVLHTRASPAGRPGVGSAPCPELLPRHLNGIGQAA